MKTKYLKTLLKLRKFAATERGERIVAGLGAALMMLALADLCLLVAGVIIG